MKNLAFVFLAFLAVSFVSCDDENGNEEGTLTLNLEGLEELGTDYVYEGWLIVDGSPVSTGVFSSVAFPQTFKVPTSTLNDASTFELSIEPAVDDDPAPSDTKLLAGDFSNNLASVSSTPLLGDMNQSSGQFILATPTDGPDTNEDSGVWFLDNSGMDLEPGLNLPDLPEGWLYEGWVVVNGTPISTGRFKEINTADDNAATTPYKGSLNDGPPYPGEDYVTGSFNGIDFPISLLGKTVVISVEPNPDNSDKPFTIKPLATQVSENAEAHRPISLQAGPVVQLSGTVTR